ncbi:MAG: threonine--tRNA ligase [Clostridiales bacterium]|jgi:threonyl-tRNA synthetase|nr:threonine--tRNA ligase [Clostridiales bacterium]
MEILLKGGQKKQYPGQVSIMEIARDIGAGLARAACAGLADGKAVDLRQVIAEDCEVAILTFEDPDGRRAYRHTASHILAQAVKRLFPETRLAIGPATDEGFYYDFDRDKPFTAEEVSAIETEMKKIIKEDLPIERFELSRQEALSLMAEEPYKLELINGLPNEAVISFYKQGDFADLCAGPHLMTTGQVKAVKLISDGGSSGAYWRGNSENKMLSRIYGAAFTKQADLDAFLTQREEAKKRDHNKLGRELRLFTTSDLVGQGLPLLMPKGAKIIQILQRFVEDEEERRGYLLTKTPYMAKPALYAASGHLDHYRDGMFFVDEDKPGDETLILRPMTCPFQFMIYNAEQHSYRDLPIRYNETSTLFRKEASGEMHGLIRVRQFTLSEGHLVCTEEQVGDEFKGVVELNKYIINILGIENDVSYRFSKWDPNNKEKYLGDAEVWDKTQTLMRDLLNSLGLPFYEADGEAAFYGPKLDIQFKNVHGKEDTAITIQIDFALGERLGMTYTDKDGGRKCPVIIHRSSIGCYERTLALLTEKYAGAFPTWLSPVQAIVLPISDKFNEYAGTVIHALKERGIRAEGDFRAEKIGYKIREARNERVPHIMVVGEKEAAEGAVSHRTRRGDEGAKPLAEVTDEMLREIETKKNNSI